MKVSDVTKEEGDRVRAPPLWFGRAPGSNSRES